MFSKEEILKILEGAKDEQGSIPFGIVKKAIGKLKIEPEWIPCSERLPEENGQYLITVKYVHVDGYEDIYAEHGDWMDGKWDMFCFGYCGQVETILAWMPLPKPYDAERRTDE